MAPGELLFQVLSTSPETAALLGTRIRPNRLEAGMVLPAATYSIVNRQPRAQTRRECTLSDEVRLQINLYAIAYADLDPLADAVRKALQEAGFRWTGEGDQYDDAGQIGGRRQDYTLILPTS
ncbi:DUF3168 domain-containing protein [Hymenobacter sp. BT175]|uniref:tail completion protein gp17 n=1 Tax=Hymenobacter translucens TaxID=2886507 RepID=UPI001D0DCBBC|nr:DUF3168 domain-containing protein [Hymenobacter translucens]MCC2547715.1 DUF3168 domain-containing protein [Hymenobacter translucens]